MGQPENAFQDQQGQWWYQHKNGTRQRLRTRTCGTCGREYPYHTHSAKRPAFCSPACLRRECKRCGTEFEPRGNSNTFCSVRCKMGPRACAECGKEFWPAKDKTRRFCSAECYYEQIVPTGTRRVQTDGYIEVKVPRDTEGTKRTMGDGHRNRWMLEHRYVMQQKLGRVLASNEHVHHVNGKRDDNRPENLELWKGPGRQPFGVRSADYHCFGCTCFD